MTKPELFQAIQTLLPYLGTYQQKGTVSVPRHDQLLLKQIWEQDIMKTNLNLGCGTCILNGLRIIASYYEREFPKYQATLPQVEVKQPEPVVEPEAMTIDKKKPCKSCKQSKDNSK